MVSRRCKFINLERRALYYYRWFIFDVKYIQIHSSVSFKLESFWSFCFYSYRTSEKRRTHNDLRSELEACSSPYEEVGMMLKSSSAS